uniref:Uncharacterized protein n=1 Tax=Amazona collaria TaxID=241587 RepID=A0A8B9G6K2_9PSIT
FSTKERIFRLDLLGSLRAHPPIVFLRYTLHVFSHTVDLLAHHTFCFYLLSSFSLNHFCP